jgi:hypothetical protein
MLTSFHNDHVRLKKEAQETSGICRYHLNTPGPGLKGFLEDPHFRMQKMGSNWRTNPVGVESDLFGLTRRLNRDLVNFNDFKQHETATTQYNYSDDRNVYVDESRATNPAFMYRTVVNNRWETPIHNPQKTGIEIPFANNLQTRILERDYFKQTIPILINENQSFYLNDSSICLGKNCN